MSAYLETLFSLRGRTALVTGASRGIGQAIANALAQAGAATTGCGRSASPAGEARFAYASCDVRDQAAFAALVERVAGLEGRIDILVNAAGITLPDEGADPLQAFEATLEVNLAAAYRCCVAVLPYMRRRGSGSIVNITSIGAEQGFPGNPGYVAAKGGLRMMSKALALDCGAANIRVNNVAPGYIRTAMTEASYADPARNAARQARMMLPRWGAPEDVAAAVLFLASDAASYITGADLHVDGGWTAKGL